MRLKGSVCPFWLWQNFPKCGKITLMMSPRTETLRDAWLHNFQCLHACEDPQDLILIEEAINSYHASIMLYFTYWCQWDQLTKSKNSDFSWVHHVLSSLFNYLTLSPVHRLLIKLLSNEEVDLRGADGGRSLNVEVLAALSYLHMGLGCSRHRYLPQHGVHTWEHIQSYMWAHSGL